MDNVKRVLSELSREVTVATRNDDLAFNGMTETIESPVLIKLLPKNIQGLRNPLSSPELMDTSRSGIPSAAKKTESGIRSWPRIYKRSFRLDFLSRYPCAFL